MTSVRLADVEAFIEENDPFTRIKMMRELDISVETAERSIHDLLDLGVIRVLDPDSPRKRYTKSEINKSLTEPDEIEERQLAFLKEISKSPEDVAQLLGTRHYEDYVTKIEGILRLASDNPTVRLAIIYAIERDIVRELRSRR